MFKLINNKFFRSEDSKTCTNTKVRIVVTYGEGG